MSSGFFWTSPVSISIYQLFALYLQKFHLSLFVGRSFSSDIKRLKTQGVLTPEEPPFIWGHFSAFRSNDGINRAPGGALLALGRGRLPLRARHARQNVQDD